MRTNRTPDEWADWCIAKNRIAEELKEYYQACTKEQLEAIIKAVDEGGDGDDEISEEEVIAILRDHAPGEIPFFQEMFAWERSRNRPQ